MLNAAAATKKIKGVKTKEAFSVNVSSKLDEIYPNGYVESATQLDNPILMDQRLDDIVKSLLSKHFNSLVYHRGTKSSAAAATTTADIETHMEKFYKVLRRNIDNSGKKIVPIEFHRYVDFDNAVGIFNAAYDTKRKRLFPARMVINLKKHDVTFNEIGQSLVINTGFVIKIKNIVQGFKLNDGSKKIETEPGKMKSNNAAEHIIVGDVKVNTGGSSSSSSGILTYPIFIDQTDTGLIMINMVNVSSEAKTIKSLNVTFYAICVNDENKKIDIIKNKDMRFGRHLKNTKAILNVNDFKGRTLDVVVDKKKSEVTFDGSVLFTVQKREIYNSDYISTPGIIDDVYPRLFGSEALLSAAKNELDFHNIAFLKQPLQLYCTVDTNSAANSKKILANKMDVKLLNGSAYNISDYKAISSNIRRMIHSIDMLKSALDECSDIINNKFPGLEQQKQHEIKVKLLKLFDFYRSFKILEELSADDVMEKISMSDQNMYESRLDHKAPLSVSILRSLRYLIEMAEPSHKRQRVSDDDNNDDCNEKKIKTE